MSYRWTDADMHQAIRKNHPAFQPFQPKPRSKFHAVRTTVGSQTFDSKREAARFGELTMLQAAGEIAALECQPVFAIDVVNLSTGELHHVGRYVADFRYRRGDRIVVEDVKSEPTKTAAYRLKKKLVEALYGIQITEVL